MSELVLDASALLAFIEDEEGADRVEEVLRGGAFLLPWLSLLEVHYVTLQERGEEEADRRFAMLTQVGGEIAWAMDQPTLLTASRLKGRNRLSLADAITAAYAGVAGATLLHKDPEYEVLAGQIELEALPYKGRRRSQ